MLLKCEKSVTVFISISFAYNLSPPALNLNLPLEECRRIRENEKAVKQFESVCTQIAEWLETFGQINKTLRENLMEKNF